MKESIKRTISWLLILVLIVGVLPVSALAVETQYEEGKTYYDSYVNPYYAEEGISEHALFASSDVSVAADAQRFTSVADAGLYLRECLLKRQEDV